MSNMSFVKKAVGYVAFGLILYLIFAIATAPAAWVAEATNRFSNGSVTLVSPRGTFWSGSGELQAGVPATGTRSIGMLRWRVNPLWLFVGRAQLKLELDGPAKAEAHVRVSPWNRNVQDLSATIPAQLIPVVYPPAAFFAPVGTIEVKAPSIDVSRDGLVAVAEAQWRGAGGRFTGNAGIGDYRLELTGKGELASINVKTLQGDLDFSGNGQWRVLPDGDLQFNGSVMPRGDVAKHEALLRAMGRDLGNGRRNIRFSRRIPIVQQLGF